MINDEEAPTGRPAGGLAWAGLYNSFFWIDPVNKVGGVFMSQLLPFVDTKTLQAFSDFEFGLLSRRFGVKKGAPAGGGARPAATPGARGAAIPDPELLPRVRASPPGNRALTLQQQRVVELLGELGSGRSSRHRGGARTRMSNIWAWFSGRYIGRDPASDGVLRPIPLVLAGSRA